MNSPGVPAGAAADTCCDRGRSFGCTVTSRICSPVRLKKCWKSVPPLVATTLTRPAPRIVP
ncbi:hypothetical protein [Streptomyces sp. NPDC058202]|uniref:hypothetical protein n=1 Tax=Streptomyces sp. NPDC058202 TaxID=3346380 RepID=UPI0036EABB65